MSDLIPGEELLWSEEPDPGALFLAKSGLFGAIVFLIFATFFIANTITSQGEVAWFFAAFFALVLGRFAWDFLAGFWTLYGITNRRLIIVHPSMFSVVVQSFYPADIDFIKKTRKSNGSGNLVFSAIREKKGRSTETVEIGFFGVETVDQVEALVISVRDLAKLAGP